MSSKPKAMLNDCYFSNLRRTIRPAKSISFKTKPNEKQEFRLKKNQ